MIGKWIARLTCVAILSLATMGRAEPLHGYVDPTIGTVGPGNVFVGPSRPFGMIKPGPNNQRASSTGYSTDPAKEIFGFSQVHVSGTGGGPKYGNVSVMPFVGGLDARDQSSRKRAEKVALGFYSVNLERWNITTDITAASHAAIYRFGFPKGAARGIKVDAGFFFNEATDPFRKDRGSGSDEAQYFVGSEIDVVSDTELRGYSRVRGGWNGGAAYTIYFHAVFDRPFRRFATWKGDTLQPAIRTQVDSGAKTGALLNFSDGDSSPLQMKIGISFISTAKARENIAAEIPRWDFAATLAETQQAWEKLLSRIEIDPATSLARKRMFYTGMYHTMLMPVDRTGENPLWVSDLPYYDDFYALWDTFRTSHPLITLVDPRRQVDIVNALLDIYRHEGYMPDARSGNANGRTQGGSHADVVIADAHAKGLKGIDYELALAAMLKNADVPPGGNEEKQGRGGLPDYNRLGYVSLQYPRGGTRTVEYALNDFAIARVAKGLGREDVFARFARQSDNWKNLWRDVTNNGTTGFIMPRDAAGNWVDSIRCTERDKAGTVRPYLPTDVDVGQCVNWWASFFYEGPSWEYSLFVPQDIAGLIEKAGGPVAFERRLDTLFDKNIFYVGNEPSFMAPTLYHWIGKPERSSQRIRTIVDAKYSDRPNGIPGNDDSGAMSSLLVFHMLGILPNAGQSYYLVNAPLVKSSAIRLANGNVFRTVARGLSTRNVFVRSATLDGRPLDRAWIEHAEIERGGTLELTMAARPGNWGRMTPPPSRRFD